MLKIAGKTWPLLVLLPAAIFRFNIWTATQPIVIPRSETYLQPAAELLEQGAYSGVETLRRTPSYPLFLACILGSAGGDLRAVTLAQHILGLAIAFIMMRLALLLWDSRIAAVATGSLISFSQSFIFYESAIESELFSVFLLSLTLLLLTKAVVSGKYGLGPMFFAGLAGGAAALGRPELAVCGITPLPFLTGKGGKLKVLAFLLPFTILIASWMFRNLLMFDYFSLTPVGAATSLQTSGPFIDWNSPAHSEFKKVYLQLLKEHGGVHTGVVNRVITRLIRDPAFGTEKALIEAAELGAETIREHPLKYLWATRTNFREFISSIPEGHKNSSDEPSANRKVSGFQEGSLLYLSLAGLVMAAFSSHRKGALFLSLCAFGIMAANCLVEIGFDRRSFAILPILALFSSYIPALVISGALKTWDHIYKKRSKA